jgi:hypothetical protein
MKKYLLMLVALCSLSFFSCTDKAATDNANANGEEAPKTEKMTEAPKPTGDAEKDAKACVDYLVQTIDETDFTDKAAQENLEKTMNSLQEEFEAYYTEKGEDAKKAFDEAGKKASENVNLEELMMKKVMEAVKAAGVDLKDTPKEK